MADKKRYEVEMRGYLTVECDLDGDPEQADVGDVLKGAAFSYDLDDVSWEIIEINPAEPAP